MILFRKDLYRHAYRLLSEHRLNTTENVLALSGYVYKDTLRIINHQLDISYIDFYKTLKEFGINKMVYYRGLLYVLWRAFIIQHHLKNKITFYVWPVIVPSYFSSKRIFRWEKISPEYLQQIKKLDF